MQFLQYTLIIFNVSSRLTFHRYRKIDSRFRKKEEEEEKRGNEYRCNDIRNDQVVRSILSMRPASVKKQT